MVLYQIAIKTEMSDEIKNLKGMSRSINALELHKEEIQNRDFKFTNQGLQLKSVARDLNKANQEVEKLTEKVKFLTKALEQEKLNTEAQDRTQELTKR